MWFCIQHLRVEEPYLNDPEASATSTVRHHVVKCVRNSLLHLLSYSPPPSPPAKVETLLFLKRLGYCT